MDRSARLPARRPGCGLCYPPACLPTCSLDCRVPVPAQPTFWRACPPACLHTLLTHSPARWPACPPASPVACPPASPCLPACLPTCASARLPGRPGSPARPTDPPPQRRLTWPTRPPATNMPACWPTCAGPPACPPDCLLARPPACLPARLPVHFASCLLLTRCLLPACMLALAFAPACSPARPPTTQPARLPAHPPTGESMCRPGLARPVTNSSPWACQ